MLSTLAFGEKYWSFNFLISFIGLTLLFGILNATVVSGTTNCNIYQDNCYIIDEESELIFTEAKLACKEKEGGNFLLAELETPEEFWSLRLWLNETYLDSGFSFWVALSDQDIEDEWKWIYSENILSKEYKHFWRSNAPNGDEIQNCARMYDFPFEVEIENFKLDDADCNTYFRYICKQQAAITNAPSTNDDLLKRLTELETIITQTDIQDYQQLAIFVTDFIEIISDWNQGTVATPEETMEFSLKALNVASNLTDIQYERYWEDLSKTSELGEQSMAEKLITEMDLFSKKVANSMLINGNQTSITISTENIIMTIKANTDAEEVIAKDLSSISVPMNVFPSSGDILFNVVSLVYKTASLFLVGEVTLKDGGGETVSGLNVGSEVINSVIFPEVSTPFKEEIRLTILKSKNGSQPECGFLVEGEGYWSQEGCEKIEDTVEYIVCTCNHLTNFAILMQLTEVETSKEDYEALELITLIGCSISILFLLITFVIFCAIIKIKSERGLIVKCLVASMALAQLLFVVGVKETKVEPLCRTIAVLLHILYLSSFFWMLIHAIHVFLKSRNFNLPPKIRLYYSLTGWGTPVVIVGITLAIKYDQYLHSEFCWLSTSDGIIYSFVGPVLLILAINLAVLIMVIKSFMSVKTNAKKNEVDKIRAGIRAILVLLPVMGLTWLFGALQFGGAAEIFAYLFAIVNSLQGLSVFVCLCLMNKEIRETLTKKIDKRIKTSSEDSKTDTENSKKHAWPSDSTSMSSSTKNKTATEVLSLSFTETRNV